MEDTTTSKPPATAASTRAANVRRAEKNSRKRAAREAARKAAARKQRQAAFGVFAAIVVVVVGIALIVKFTGGSPKADSTASRANPSAAATAPTDAAPTDAATTAPPANFPPVPAGADSALKTKPVVKGGSGQVTKLDVKTLIQGKGAVVKSGDSITVNYVGVTYADGKEFDSSWSHSEAFTTAIGQHAVIDGWDQGLVGVKVGSRVQLDIPQALAYPNPANGQPAGTLRFVVDVLADTPGAS